MRAWLVGGILLLTGVAIWRIATVQADAFTREEVARLARLIGELRDSDRLEERGRLHAQIDAEITAIEASGRKPIRAVDSWTRVFTHPALQKREGRAGSRLNQKAVIWRALDREAEVRYQTIAPTTYDGTDPVPVVTCLHPLDGTMRGADFLRALYSSSAVQSRALLFAPEAPPRDEPFSWSRRDCLYRTFSVLGAYVNEDYLLDRNAMFLDGYGDAATDVWRLYSQLGTMFAGVIIRGAAPPPETRFDDFSNTSVLLIGIPGTDLDPVRADIVATKLRAAGCDVTVAKLDRPVPPGVERDAFAPIDATLAAFLETRRNPYPTTIDWSVKETHTHRSYWLAAWKTEPGGTPSWFRATIDKDRNRITATTRGIAQLMFRLNHKLLDLDRPVTIEVDGRVRFSGLAEPTLETLVQDYQPSDPAQLYSWVKVIELPR